MEERLKERGLENFGGGDLLWQEIFEHKLMDPNEPDALACVKWLAEQGHASAQAALRNYAIAVLERGDINLEASVRSYLINILAGRVAPHPPDHQNDVIRHLLRDIGVAAMVDVAADRWELPRLNSSSSRKSAAHYVGGVMTEYGIPLSERQVRRIVQRHENGYAKRMTAFLLSSAVEQTI
jgi:hypothetical protein